MCYNFILSDAPVAQGIEQRTSNPLAARSIRARRAIYRLFKLLVKQEFFCCLSSGWIISEKGMSKLKLFDYKIVN